MSAVAERFEVARRNERQLNDRQRRVLDLLVAGKTNGEIGDALGMTLDGAKWNVSEILGKLALESREEAAEFWRWRSRPAGKLAALRGLAGLGTLKWVGGSAAVIAGVAVVGALARDDTQQGSDLPPFYLEAKMEIVDTSRTIGTNIAGAELEPEYRAANIRWWHQDADRSRVEIDTTEPEESAGVDVILADGDEQIYYRHETNTYTRTALFDFPPEAKLRVRPWSFSSLVGPWPSEVAGLDELIDQFRQFGGDNDPDPKVEIVGHETLLGRRTTIVEVTMLSGEVTSSSEPGAQPVRSTREVSSRYWVDEERMVIMKQVTDGGAAQNYTVEVTRLDWDTRIPNSKFAFQPPTGSRQESDASPSGLLDAQDGRSNASTGPAGSIGFSTPPGMYRFPSPPEGFRAAAVSTNHDSSNSPNLLTIEYRSDGMRAFVLEQRIRAGGAKATFEGEPVTVDGRPANLHENGERTTLAWAEGELLVYLTGFDIPGPELIALAELLERVP